MKTMHTYVYEGDDRDNLFVTTASNQKIADRKFRNLLKNEGMTTEMLDSLDSLYTCREAQGF